MIEKIYTLVEAAKILRISPVTLRLRIKAKQIGYIREAGKLHFTEQQIKEYVERHIIGVGAVRKK